MNFTTVTGRLVRDPELQTTKTGQEKCRFTVADELPRGKDKDMPPRVNFFNCDAWQQTGAFVSKWFKKGSPIIVHGQLDSYQVEKDNGKVTYWTLKVERVGFQQAKKEDFEPSEPPAVDEQSGMEKVEVSELPF